MSNAILVSSVFLLIAIQGSDAKTAEWLDQQWAFALFVPALIIDVVRLIFWTQKGEKK